MQSYTIFVRMTVFPTIEDKTEIIETAQRLLSEHLDGSDFIDIEVEDAMGNDDAMVEPKRKKGKGGILCSHGYTRSSCPCDHSTC